MVQVSANLKNLFLTQKHPGLKVEVGFLSDYFFFFSDLLKLANFIFSELIMSKVSSKSETKKVITSFKGIVFFYFPGKVRFCALFGEYRINE